MTDYRDIIYDINNAVATIAFNRPKSLNAFTGDTILELEDALQHAIDARDVGVIVLTGVGERAFCVGGDVKWESDGGLEDLDFKINRMIIECLKPDEPALFGTDCKLGL